MEADLVDVSVITNGKLAMASLIPKEGIKRTPCDLVCVVDVSGSMGAAATLKNAAGKEENNGLTVLDVVKHAVKTIIASLDKDDRLALVTFNDKGEVVLDLTAMNDAGHNSATASTEAMHHGGSTNIWDGCLQGLEVLRKKAGDGRNRAVLLLTDGEPVVVPEGGHLAALNRYKDSHDGLPGTVCTFGFGYALDSNLLLELSVGGNGSFAFIPDSSFTGTVFVHALACLQTTVASALTLSFEPDTETQVSACLGTHPHIATSWGTQIKFGSLLAGQSKDVIIELSRADFAELSVTLKYRDIRTGKEHTKSVTAKSSSSSTSKEALGSLERNRLRLKATQVIADSMAKARAGDYNGAVDLVKAFVKEINASSEKGNALIKDLLKDAEGQMCEAVSRKDFYEKWGRHYLPSLQGAHLSQMCNNFKDPGVQHYVSKLFKALRDNLDETFLKLPAPKPSRPVASSSYSGGGASSSTRSAAPVNMSSYYSSGNPCFGGSSSVLMADKSLKAVQDIAKGDLVASSLYDDRQVARVECVVRTRIVSGHTRLVTLPDSGLLVTPYHPIRVRGDKWRFPCELSEPRDQECCAVYSFVVLPEVGQQRVMVINGVEAVALGHGLDTCQVVQHAYFGTERVLRDLMAMPGWAEGCVHLTDGQCLQRDAETGLVTALVPHSTTAAVESF